MAEADPLARPVWSSLTGRWAPLTSAVAGARRLDPDYGVFAAIDDRSPETLEALGELVRRHGETALVKPDPAPSVPGVEVAAAAAVLQMVARRPVEIPDDGLRPAALIEEDAAEMFDLAILTKPGPWRPLTHRFGGFIGLKRDGRLVAMAGERMRVDGATEVSGVCTRPGYRGRGYGAGLLTRVAAAMQQRGETPFLHVYAWNTGAIALYEQLGFSVGRELTMTTLKPASSVTSAV